MGLIVEQIAHERPAPTSPRGIADCAGEGVGQPRVGQRGSSGDQLMIQAARAAQLFESVLQIDRIGAIG
jgi:hypothetical protein